MPKNIKFFMVMNKEEIRSLDDLRENFHAQDIFYLYQGGILQRWLESEGLTEHVAAIEKMSAEQLDTRDILQALVTIFFETTDISVEAATHYIDFLQKNITSIQELKKNHFEKNTVLVSYHRGYDDIKKQIVARNNDMTFAREAVRDIADNYMELFKLDFQAFTEEMCVNAPAVILTLLTNEQIRNWLKSSNNESHIIESTKKIIKSREFSHFIPQENKEDQPSEIKTLIKTLYKNTDSAWDDVEPNTKEQFMIMDIPGGCKVRDFLLSKDVSKRIEITPDSVQDNFPIVNGIEYNSRNGTSPLIYMEV